MTICEGYCNGCMFPSDYPEMFKVIDGIRDAMDSDDHDSYEKAIDKECYILWSELEDGKGIPKDKRGKI